MEFSEMGYRKDFKRGSGKPPSSGKRVEKQKSHPLGGFQKLKLVIRDFG